jgi:hypothetical protein
MTAKPATRRRARRYRPAQHRTTRTARHLTMRAAAHPLARIHGRERSLHRADFPLYSADCRPWAACRKRADLLTRLRAREPARAVDLSSSRRFTTNAAKEVVSRASSTPRIADTI